MALFDFLKRKEKKEERVIAKEKSEKQNSVRVAAQEKPMTKESGQTRRASLAESKRAVSGRMLTDIIRPHVTERSRAMSQRGVYMFRVSEKATKHTVADAIEALYHVSVVHVRTLRIPSKPRRLRGLTRGTKKGYKKAAVTLRAGEHIELFS